MKRWSAGTAAATWVLGRVVLGARWGGVQVAPGVWRDSVALWQWATLWVLLAVLGFAVASRVPRWPYRLAALVPLLAWIAWSLRGGTLGPIPLAIYGVPTLVAWCGALLVRDAMRRA
jgi:hypothetical protein